MNGYISIEAFGLMLAIVGLMAPWFAWLTWTLLAIKQLIAADIRVTQELIHYVRWSAKQHTGASPPPYVSKEVGEE